MPKINRNVYKSLSGIERASLYRLAIDRGDADEASMLASTAPVSSVNVRDLDFVFSVFHVPIDEVKSLLVIASNPKVKDTCPKCADREEFERQMFDEQRALPKDVEVLVRWTVHRAMGFHGPEAQKALLNLARETHKVKEDARACETQPMSQPSESTKAPQ